MCPRPRKNFESLDHSMFLPQRNSIEPPRYVTRMPGGVGGAAPRGAPLSRSITGCFALESAGKGIC
jgi:hypothetical protein